MALETQRKINASGSMRALCMLSLDALKKTMQERCNDDEMSLSLPSAILIDYAMIQKEEELLKLIQEHPRLAVVPLFFALESDQMNEEEACYEKGAMVVLQKPVTWSGITRIERAAWQYEVTKKYERILQKQVSEIQAAKEIYCLNQQLKSRNEFLYRIFGKYFSDEVLEVILEKPEGALIGGERRNAAILMADLRGFSSVAEEMDADEMTELLNEFFGTMVEIISDFGGTIIEFMGDGLLAVFGAPVTMENYRECAIAAGIRMQNAMKNVNSYCIKKGHDILKMGIGIHCGEVFVGNVGSEKMMRYNVLGRVVNECSRIEGCNIGEQVLVSEDMLEGLSCEVSVCQRAEIAAKGIKNPVTVCEVKGIGGVFQCYLEAENPEKRKKVPERIILKLHEIRKKVIMEVPVSVVLKELSEKEALVEMMESKPETEIEDYADVEVRMESCGEQAGFSGIYAKMVQKNGNTLKLCFTHVNQNFRNFVTALQNRAE